MMNDHVAAMLEVEAEVKNLSSLLQELKVANEDIQAGKKVSVTKKIDTLVNQVGNMAHNIKDKLEAANTVTIAPFYGEHYPLSVAILNEPVPQNFQMPNCEYNGDSDPKDHLRAYIAAMLVNGPSDALLCKVFPATLKGKALAWFSSSSLKRLAPITSFTQLAKIFGTFFFTRVNPEPNMLAIIQRDGESLRGYVDRCKYEVMNSDPYVWPVIVEGLKDQTLAMNLMVRGFEDIYELFGALEKTVKRREKRERQQ